MRASWFCIGVISIASSGAAPSTVPVIAHDYAFAAPDTVAAGLTSFSLENRGTRQHEMLIGLLRPGVNASQIIAAAQRGTNFRLLPEVYLDGAMHGGLFAWPGSTSPAHLTLSLIRGRSYVLLCTFRDSTTGPQHAALGMFHLIQVR
jgi:hypothetical protein